MKIENQLADLIEEFWDEVSELQETGSTYQSWRELSIEYDKFKRFCDKIYELGKEAADGED